ncbi:MAG: hypothetical protein QW569_05115 [Candidatus Bathyarchaeia archaeon]
MRRLQRGVNPSYTGLRSRLDPAGEPSPHFSGFPPPWDSSTSIHAVDEGDAHPSGISLPGPRPISSGIWIS